MKKIIKSFCTTVFILGVVFVAFYHSSCQITPEGINLIGQENFSPKITSFLVDGETINVSFSKKVIIEDSFAIEVENKNTSIDDFLNVAEENKIEVEFVEAQENSKTNDINFNILGKTKIGKYYELYCRAKDQNGNTMSFSIPFFGENKNFPKIIISEISDKYEKKSDTFEYIELYVLSDGNLFGLEILTGSDNKVFELPCVDVKKGEYVLVHLRSPENYSAVTSELSNNLNLSTYAGSVLGARDIWIENVESVFSPSAEIVVLNNRQKNKILDCLVYCTNEYQQENSTWKSENLLEAATKCTQAKCWSNEIIPQNAVYSTERKAMTYISRKENLQEENNNLVWIGTTKSQSSPGKANIF